MQSAGTDCHDLERATVKAARRSTCPLGTVNLMRPARGALRANCGECDAEVNLSKKNPDRWRPGFSVEPFCQSGDKRHEFLSRLKGYADLVNAALTVRKQCRLSGKRPGWVSESLN